ncbi:uncharacterized protein Z519_08417 [Cladophialophora bantiana CBS 173.52]|uniref:Uncharacterized protein n=1 Tax=Cladophialophora bantiana (strain ATCC 10958 / CBS 173.52 / CDC B-1940 / NIH 8579) TaxID=1442370 RepID=A0A0D2I179_CLAB1|nr:uncharacterized protein Z519_08417 [Cladophialophora bantiana CBS 173.52]KIW90634.1 hypothetical protein Z519_08417 [Cladophialophora bantiana CBS 173.52]
MQNLAKEEVAQTSSQVATTPNYGKTRNIVFVRVCRQGRTHGLRSVDFFALKEMVDLINVKNGEQSQRLNAVALSASIILLPFTVVGTVFGIDSTEGGLKLFIDNFSRQWASHSW